MVRKAPGSGAFSFVGTEGGCEWEGEGEVGCMRRCPQRGVCYTRNFIIFYGGRGAGIGWRGEVDVDDAGDEVVFPGGGDAGD